MELYRTIISLTIVLSTSADFEHEGYQFEICSTTELEFFLGYDNEELWHINFNQKTGVMTLPKFFDPISFPGFYERGVYHLAKCNSNLKNNILGFKNPTPEMDAPQTSIYPKYDVELGVQNSLICHVTGFYPPSVNISWTKNDVNVTEGISLSQYRPKADGTFNIFSTLKFTPTEGDIYSCTVNHKALQGQPQSKMWDVDGALSSVGPAVFCGLGLTLGLLGVATGTALFVKGKNCH